MTLSRPRGLVTRIASGVALALLAAAFISVTPVRASLAVQVVSATPFNDSHGTVRIFGEVANLGTENADLVYVTCRLDDASRRTESTLTEAAVLAPGEKSPFDVVFQLAPVFNNVSCSATAAMAASASNHNFSVRDVTPGQFGTFRGNVVNNNAVAASNVKVMATYYNGTSAVYEHFTVVPYSQSPIPPGQSTPFTVDAPPASVNWTARAWLVESSTPPSPSPGALRFGSQVVGTTSPILTITLTNSDPTDRHLGKVEINPALEFAALTDTCSFATLRQGQRCTVGVAFTPAASGSRAATLSIPDDLPILSHLVPLTGNGVDAGSASTFYFAEGFTGAGFTETLSLFMPNQDGGAVIDYDYVAAGGAAHLKQSAFLVAGRVTNIDVNAAVGADRQVSARVTLPGPGVVERTMHFNFGPWRGSTGKVGATRPDVEWDFAEGSTLPFFSEFLTLQNPNNSVVPVALNYFTDAGLTPVKQLSLPANSRTTVEVFNGDISSTLTGQSCLPNGPGANCGVGMGIGGVSVQVKSSTLPVIAERPFYVNGLSFGSGPIRDGHDAFGANAPALTWYFAEGTTLTGFNEYLTLQNPGTLQATVNLRYVDTGGLQNTKTLMVEAHSRATVEVFKGDRLTGVCSAVGPAPNCGVGSGLEGVSVQVVSDQPIVAERPMYMYFDFGSGVVAGAHVVVGATGLARLFGFAAVSTAAGESDFLTIQNPGGTAASVTVTYYARTGYPIVRTITVAAHSRHTVEVFKTAEGAGPGYDTLGIVVSSDQPVLVEKPTYNSTAAGYGATDTAGYTPAGF